MNFCANFQLTSRRNDLLYEIRKLKKEGKICKFYLNENGQISLKVKENSAKIKVTFFTNNKGDFPKTLTISDITEIINSTELN